VGVGPGALGRRRRPDQHAVKPALAPERRRGVEHDARLAEAGLQPENEAGLAEQFAERLALVGEQRREVHSDSPSTIRNRLIYSCVNHANTASWSGKSRSHCGISTSIA